jgi:hypothetical protein
MVLDHLEAGTSTGDLNRHIAHGPSEKPQSFSRWHHGMFGRWPCSSARPTSKVRVFDCRRRAIAITFPSSLQFDGFRKPTPNDVDDRDDHGVFLEIAAKGLPFQ